MNDLFAADPATCRHSSDLRLLLNSFGPYTGRYLANYPNDWSARIQGGMVNLGEIEAARIQTLLRRARESISLITRSNLPWNDNITWIDNALPKLNTQPAIFSGLIAQRSMPPAVHEFQGLELPPTAEERVEGTGDEYVRISKILLLMSPEIALIDPYLNPLKRSYALILRSIFATLAKGRCKRVLLWARASELVGARNDKVILQDIDAALRNFSEQAKFSSGFKIEMVLVQDEDKNDKMHGRYLLSIKGGIRFDQGFQKLAVGRFADVGPVGRSVHDDLLNIYFDGKHDMQIVHRIAVEI